MKDRETGRGKGFGYVQFGTPELAGLAMAALNGADIGGRSIRCDYAQQRDRPERAPRGDRPERQAPATQGPTNEPSDTVFVGNLAFDVSEEILRNAFSAMGTIVSVRVVFDRETNRSKGFGYVQFDSVEAAKAAMSLSGQEIGGRNIRCDFAASARRERPEGAAPRAPRASPPAGTSAPSATLFVGNLPYDVTEDSLKGAFSRMARVKGARLVLDRETGRAKGFGYVEFFDLEGAAQGLKMNGQQLGGRSVRVDYAQTRSDDAAAAPAEGAAPRARRGGR